MISSKKWDSKIMNKIVIEGKNGQSTIYIGTNLLKDAPEIIEVENYSKLFIILDENIKKNYLDKIKTSFPKAILFEIKSGENEKNIESAQNIWRAMQDAKCDRKSLVVNIGGGVVTDLGGFAASLFMRGVKFVNIPTTLLSQVDASVGGKTGIDFNGVKNLIGTFNQPVKVIIDTDFLKTLPKRQFLSGFAEIIKHGLISDKEYFEKVTSKRPLEFTDDEMMEIIFHSCEIKAQIIEGDEEETGKRKLLNFGHTVGHAIESLSLETSSPLLHGEAISLGMLVESKISELEDLLTHDEFSKIRECFTQAELPIMLGNTEIKLSDIFERMKSDKKNVNGLVNFTLITSIGNAVIDKNVAPQTIEEAFETIL